MEHIDSSLIIMFQLIQTHSGSYPNLFDQILTTLATIYIKENINFNFKTRILVAIKAYLTNTAKEIHKNNDGFINNLVNLKFHHKLLSEFIQTNNISIIKDNVAILLFFYECRKSFKKNMNFKYS